MAEHTPGPWRVEDIGSPENTLHVIADNGAPSYDWQFLATVSDDFEKGVDWGQTQANARLIAAAPELLTACEALLDLIASGQRYGRAEDAARGVVAKAREGEREEGRS